MVTKNDLVLLLTEMQEKGHNVTPQITKVMLSEGIAVDVLKFVNDNRQLDIVAFYEMLRKNYNSKKSPLYKNLVREDVKEAEDVLTTLASLNLQILLFAKKLEDDRMFLSHSRADEITSVLNNYYKTYDLRPCFRLMRLIKADLKAFESIR